MDYTGSIYRLIDRAEDEMKEYGFLSGSVALCCCMGSQPAPETNQKSEERSSTNESQTSM